MSCPRSIDAYCGVPSTNHAINKPSNVASQTSAASKGSAQYGALKIILREDDDEDDDDENQPTVAKRENE